MAEKLSSVGTLACFYDKSPVIRALLQLVPFWGAADTLLRHRVDEISKERLKTFFDELADGKHELSEEVIQDEDFLHCYFCTLRAALHTRHREKIKLLARLLKSSINTTTDEFEELLSVMDDITLREFSILCNLREYELRVYPITKNDEWGNLLDYWYEFKRESIRKFSIPENTFTAFMARLERTGFYLRIIAGPIDYDGDFGRTTPFFDRLLELVRNNGPQPQHPATD